MLKSNKNHLFLMRMPAPNYIVHYYHAERIPLQNLSDLQHDARNTVISELNNTFETGTTQRYFPEWYMPQRLEAEAAMRKRFLDKGGKPQRNSPHYFTLGFSALFATQYLDQTRKLVLPVDVFDESELCFCLNDSLWTMAQSHDLTQQFNNRWYEGDVFSYHETKEILHKLAVNVEDPESLKNAQIAFVEALVWSDHKVSHLR